MTLILLPDNIYNIMGGHPDVLVIDNPGFGVLKNKNNDVFKAESYYGFTGIFNQNYSSRNRYWLHEGLDTRSWATGEIVSFITGKVVESGEHRSYGLFMLIQSVCNPTHFYLIAHLKEKLKEKKDFVYPGDIVAIAGQTGSDAVHLHTSFYKIEDEKFSKIVEYNDENDIFYFYLEDNKDLHFNPINHNELWDMSWD